MSRLRTVILCGRSPRHLYVANRLCEAGDVLAIVHETGTQWTGAKLKKLLNPKNLGRKAWRWLRDRRRYTGGSESKFFFGANPAVLHQPELVVEVPHINHAAVTSLVDQLDPEVIAVFGTSLIRGELLSRGKLGIVNLHGGLSPQYRGADCTFWALYNNEPEQVGCTLHFIDGGIDTGRIIAHVCPEVGPGDGELPLFWRAVRDSAEVYAEIFGRLRSGERLGVPQKEKGRLYQIKDRGLRHERELARKIASGMLHDVRLPARVRWFAGSSEIINVARAAREAA